MADPSVLSVLRVPGSLFVDAVGNAGPGTALGSIRDVQLRRTEGRAQVRAEEFGVELVETIYGGAIYRLGFALRGWDVDAINAVFPNTVLGASGRDVIWPGPKKAGYHRSSDAVRLEFVPKEPTQNGIVFKSAIPEIAVDLEVDLAHRQEHLILCVFRAQREGATPDGSVTWGPNA